MEMMDSPIGVCIVEMHESVIESNKYGEQKHGFMVSFHGIFSSQIHSILLIHPFLFLSTKGYTNRSHITSGRIRGGQINLTDIHPVSIRLECHHGFSRGGSYFEMRFRWWWTVLLK